MDDTLFRDLIDRHGGEIDDWPEILRPLARLQLATSANAQRMMDDARALRLAFNAMPAIKAPEGLTSRIFAAAFGDHDPSERALQANGARGDRRRR